MKKLTPKQRLEKIAEIIEEVDDRCLFQDGPVTPTVDEITPSEIKEIYKLAKGKNNGKIR